MKSKNYTKLKSVEYKIVLGSPRSRTTFLMKCLNGFPYSECISGHLLPILLPHLVNHSFSPEIHEALSRSIEFSFKDYLESTQFARISIIHRWLIGYINVSEMIEALQGKIVKIN